MTTSKKLTYVDSSVLINAAVGLDAARRGRAVQILGDQNREFAATRFLILEVIPIPTRYKLSKELNFYKRFFDNVTVWIDEARLIQPAIDMTCLYGLNGMDALHLAAAISINAEFVSAERTSKPIYAAYANIFSIY